jgi:hypothetical protein
MVYLRFAAKASLIRRASWKFITSRCRALSRRIVSGNPRMHDGPQVAKGFVVSGIGFRPATSHHARAVRLRAVEARQRVDAHLDGCVPEVGSGPGREQFDVDPYVRAMIRSRSARTATGHPASCRGSRRSRACVDAARCGCSRTRRQGRLLPRKPFHAQCRVDPMPAQSATVLLHAGGVDGHPPLVVERCRQPCTSIGARAPLLVQDEAWPTGWPSMLTSTPMLASTR